MLFMSHACKHLKSPCTTCTRMIVQAIGMLNYLVWLSRSTTQSPTSKYIVLWMEWCGIFWFFYIFEDEKGSEKDMIS